MKLIPLGDKVLVRPAEADEKSKGGIILPDASKEKPRRGEVLAVGPGRRNETGTIEPMQVQVGSVVLFDRYAANKVELEGEEYLILAEKDILGTVVPGKIVAA